jgi:hypothetical protein
VNSDAEPFGHAATHAPHPMHAAASIDASASCFGTGIAFASCALPVGAVMKPPDAMMRSSAPRFTTRSLMMGNARARHGSMTIVSPSRKVRMWSWQVAVPREGPCATPLIIIPQDPQIPSRQSWSKAIGISPCSISRSLTTSSISRKDMSGLTSVALYSLRLPSAVGPDCRHTCNVRFIAPLTCSSAARA